MSTKKQILKPGANGKGRNVSIRQIAGKVADIVRKPFSNDKIPSKKKPFGGKGGRKRKPTEDELRMADAKVKIYEFEKDEFSQSEPEQQYSSITSAFNNFFYTDDKFITQFEDNDILEYIRAAYPEYNPRYSNELTLKKVILQILENSNFVSSLMAKYNMTIFDFFKFLFRMEPSIFKGTFITKIQKAISRKKYASVKRHYYKFQNKQAKRVKQKAKKQEQGFDRRRSCQTV